MLLIGICAGMSHPLSFQYPSDERVTLTGYGVELAVKSTEYKAVDDTEVKGQPSPSLWCCCKWLCVCRRRRVWGGG